LSDIRDLLDWFGRRKGDSVHNGMRKHSLAVLDVISDVGRAVAAMCASDAQTALKCIDRMILSEREADRIEERLCADITGGELSVQEREDLLRIARKTDKVAGWAMEAGIHIQMSIEIGVFVPAEIWDSMKLMSSELVLAAKMLVKAYENIVSNPSETERAIEAVKDQERVIDQIHFANVKKMLMTDMDYKATMLMRGLVESMETSADACKSCAETLSMLMTARRH